MKRHRIEEKKRNFVRAGREVERVRSTQKKMIGLAAVFGTAVVLGVSHWFYHSYFSPVQIGFSAGLSGAKSELGVNGRNGALLAVEDINRQGGIRGRTLELVVTDDKNDPLTAVEVDRRLADQGIRVVVGHMISGVAEGTVAQANARNLLLISPTISTEELTAIDDFFIRIIPSNAVQGGSLAQAALRQTGARNIAIVYDRRNEAFAQPIIKAFTAALGQGGGRIVMTETFQRQGEFSGIIQAIGQSGADGVLMIASALDAGMFCQQSRKAAVKLPLFLPMWTMTNDFIQAGGEDADGAYLISQVDLGDQTPAYRQFRQTYQERYGEEPTFAAILSYDATFVAASGIEAAGNDSASRIKAAILRRGEFSGLQGKLHIDPYGDLQTGYYLYRVQAGAFQKVGRL